MTEALQIQIGCRWHLKQITICISRALKNSRLSWWALPIFNLLCSSPILSTANSPTFCNQHIFGFFILRIFDYISLFTFKMLRIGYIRVGSSMLGLSTQPNTPIPIGYSAFLKSRTVSTTLVTRFTRSIQNSSMLQKTPISYKLRNLFSDRWQPQIQSQHREFRTRARRTVLKHTHLPAQKHSWQHGRQRRSCDDRFTWWEMVLLTTLLAFLFRFIRKYEKEQIMEDLREVLGAEGVLRTKNSDECQKQEARSMDEEGEALGS